jgi:hypothetical protein
LKAFSTFKVRLGIFFIQIGSNGQVLDRLAEVSKDCEDKSPKIEIFWNVIFTLLDGFINIGNWFIKVVLVEIEDSSKIIKRGDVIVGKLREMRNTDC